MLIKLIFDIKRTGVLCTMTLGGRGEKLQTIIQQNSSMVPYFI